MSRNRKYEQQNRIDSHGKSEIKCKNYKLCKTSFPDWWYDSTLDYLCLNCLNFKWNELEFKENEECTVCMEVGPHVKFPTNCGHWFCTSCSSDILFWNERRSHLSPEDFGCPPCPNECQNPSKGFQCDCEEYEDTISKWRSEYTHDYERWNDANNLSDSDSDPNYCDRTCPSCRKKYE